MASTPKGGGSFGSLFQGRSESVVQGLHWLKNSLSDSRLATTCSNAAFPPSLIFFPKSLTARRRLAWTAQGWEDYLYWQTQDRKTLKRINTLIEDALRDDPFEGIGKPEALKHALAGAWSRRIDQEHRFVYIADDQYVTILQARYHY